MLFNSISFIIFFPLVLLTYFFLPHKFRWVHLLIASSIFYAAFIPSYIIILFALIIIDYFAGILIYRSSKKRLWLWLSICANIALLGVFKYYNFFISNINELTGSNFILLNIVLPIGLSFHTFQSMSYTFEVYRGNQKPELHLGYYSVYVMFFPQLVAGPIERPQNLLHQFHKPKKFSAINLYEGLRLMSWGFLKKIVVADRLGIYVDGVYANTEDVNSWQVWVAIIFFVMQIYADFSGYSDIAIGSAKCLGIDLMINFKRPLFSVTISEFWNRWHISLSSWLKDYVFIPLAVSKRNWGIWAAVYATIVTFFFSGLWHGAGWNFILWGILNGVFIVFEMLLNIRSPQMRKSMVKRILGIVYVNIVFVILEVFFRSSSLSQSFVLLEKAFSFSGGSISTLKQVPGIVFGGTSLLISFGLIVYVLLIESLTDPLMKSLNNYFIADVSLIVTSCLLITFFGIFNQTGFIYFQF